MVTFEVSKFGKSIDFKLVNELNKELISVKQDESKLPKSIDSIYFKLESLVILKKDFKSVQEDDKYIVTFAPEVIWRYLSGVIFVLESSPLIMNLICSSPFLL